MKNPRLCYQTIEFGDIDIHLCTLRNKQEFHDPDGVAEKLGISSATWPLFGVVWPSSLVLAHYVQAYETHAKRILEVGCGMALSSLLLNKQAADITATDHHPEAESFLHRNTALNDENDIAFERVDWADKVDDLGLFDLIIGSDLLYDDGVIELLAEFIERHAMPACAVIIVDPGRGLAGKLSTLMTALGFSVTRHKPDNTDYLDKAFDGYILEFERLA